MKWLIFTVPERSFNSSSLSPRFLKKRYGYCNRLHPSVHLSICPSVTLPPPKPLEEIQPNLVCELLTWMGCATALFLPRPLGPRGGAKRSSIVKFQIQLQLLSQFQIFLNQTYQVGFSFRSLGHAPGVGLGALRDKNKE